VKALGILGADVIDPVEGLKIEVLGLVIEGFIKVLPSAWALWVSQ
jgi:hypothetical protein